MDATSPELAGAAPAVPIQRQDARSRDIVDVGIAMQMYASTVSAVEFLRSQNIGARVIERVLGEPERRRPKRA
jgi:hypothetical protein